MKKAPQPRSLVGKIIDCTVIVFIVLVIAGVFIGPGVGHSESMARKSAMMQTVRQIGLQMYAYAHDHNGHYPEGKSSTEVFQQLIDAKYVDDPMLFFVYMPGKVKPESNQLKPENVSWDVTCCVDSSAPDSLPVVFLTGYKVTYQAGVSAKLTDQSPRTWSQWWNGPEFTKTFIAVYYMSNSAMVKRMNDDGVIPDFIPADFDPKGKTYRQLVP